MSANRGSKYLVDTNSEAQDRIGGSREFVHGGSDLGPANGERTTDQPHLFIVRYQL